VIAVHDPRLLDTLERLEAAWQGMVWRQVIGDIDPLRANSRGARWNPPDTEALYCSLTREGAEVELRTVLSRQPIPVRRRLVPHRIRVSVARAADLRGGALAEAGYEEDALTGEDWTAPQRIGAGAVWLGIAALIVPSARHGGGNVVVFVNELQPEDVVELLPQG